MSEKKTGESYSPKKPIIREVDGARWAGDLEGAPVRRRGGIVMFFPGMTEAQVADLERDIIRRSARAHGEVLRRHLVRGTDERRDAWNRLVSSLPAAEVERILKEQFNLGQDAMRMTASRPLLTGRVHDPELSLRQRQAIARARANTGMKFHYPTSLGIKPTIRRWKDQFRVLANRAKLLIVG